MLTIKILGTDDLPDFEAAEQLKELLAESIPSSAKGEIVIFPSFKCFGQAVRDIDLVVFGLFDPPFKRKIKTKGKTKNGVQQDLVFRDVNVKSFCCCIEVKDHPPAKIDISMGSGVVVQYRGKRHNATEQSEKQKYSLINSLKDIANGWSPYISNLIWLRNVSKESLKAKYPPGEWFHNCLPSSFKADWFLQLICYQTTPYNHGGNGSYLLSCTKYKDESLAVNRLKQVYDRLSKVQRDLGSLTRQKLEKITKSSLLKDQKYARAIGQKLVVIRGRAGTGKTIKLLHIAHDLCLHQEKRCLILTYNKALVSDIRRTLALADITSDITSPSIQVRTVHSFMYQIMVGFGVLEKSQKDSFLDRYEELKETLIKYLDEGVLGEKDIQSLMKKKQHELAWDAVLVDESQDWPNNEREILFKLFSSDSFIIADGVDQLVRESVHTDWISNVDYHKPIISEKKSLRQKANLCRFCSSFAKENDLAWDVSPKSDISGGKVLLLESDYTLDLHNQLLNDCVASGNKQYEMMFLVPPSLVHKEPHRSFLWRDEWKKMGIHLWDGTASDVRSEFPTDTQQHRLLQYDSCRGLEGWVVVCLHLDAFFEHKQRTFSPDLENQLALYSTDELKKNFASQWLMMPFTRAIDTIVISFQNSDSEIAQTLRKIGDQRSDFVEFV